MTRQEVLFKLIKLRELRARGEPGEQSNAATLMSRLMVEHGVTEADLDVPLAPWKDVCWPSKFLRRVRGLLERVKVLKRICFFDLHREEWTIRLANVERELDLLVADIVAATHRVPAKVGGPVARGKQNCGKLHDIQRRYL